MRKSLHFISIIALLLGMASGAKAQFLVNEELPVPTPKPATKVYDYSYYANWEALDGVDGFMVFNYLINQATEDGQKLYLFNDDFSWIDTESTTDAPDDYCTDAGGMYLSDFDDRGREGWVIYNAVYANGVFGLNNSWGYNAAYGQMMSPSFNFSLGDGKVYVDFTVKGQEGAKTIQVSLKKSNVLFGAVIDSKTIDVTEEWQHHTVELDGGIDGSYVYIQCIDMGNSTDPLYYFFDDLSIYQYFNKGEEAVIPYSYIYQTDPSATSVEVDTDPDEDGEYGYKVVSYVQGLISPYSDMVYVSRGGDGIAQQQKSAANAFVANGKLCVANPQGEAVSVYNTQGQLVYTNPQPSRNAEISLGSKGMYIVKIGNKYSTKLLYNK